MLITVIPATNSKDPAVTRTKTPSQEEPVQLLRSRLVDAFGGNIASSVEEAVSEKINEGIAKLDKFLQSLPKQIPLDKTSALNVSFVGNPVLSNSSIAIAINGLFTERSEVVESEGYKKGFKISSACGGLPNMIKVSLHEYVIQSASLVYFNAGKMQLIIDELPDQVILNTAECRFIVPQLYKQYPYVFDTMFLIMLDILP
ncbi:putative BPI/LBP family protein At1g04970 [Lotus japonicus]|uniref:putative BPI/LBP family protein At1g04970 n=1 Tax=Lotus japonicus TaxID=34305 RepID=UPI00258BE0CD|nr:putative BPI/LBP family protein At1g04970 [Lotus japonicus]